VEQCRRAGFSPDVVQEAGGANTILGLVAAGLGVSVLAGSYASLRGDDVAFVPLAGRSTTLQAVWRADDGSPARENFVSVASRVSRTLDGVS
jgi:DNA-binding transcriptional LysR family regulator